MIEIPAYVAFIQFVMDIVVLAAIFVYFMSR